MEEETLNHALGDCPANCGLLEKLLTVVRAYQPGATTRTVFTLDLELDQSLELPMTWAIGSLLLSIYTQRETGRVSIPRTRADLESKLLLKSYSHYRESSTHLTTFVNFDVILSNL